MRRRRPAEGWYLNYTNILNTRVVGGRPVVVLEGSEAENKESGSSKCSVSVDFQWE